MKVRNALLSLLCFITSASFGQSFMNEWIDHGKTYYRFKVGSKGVCRISKAQLTSLGIGDADAAHFQLWRRGEEVPVYTSVETGSLPADGFLEFWGQINDGSWEKRLYLRPEYQINSDYSLLTDTSVYFLTINPQGNNMRLKSMANDISSSLTADSFFMHKITVSYKDQYSQGFAAVVGSEVFSSSYDNGEGYVSANINSASGANPPSPLSSTLNNLFVATGTDQGAFFRYTAAGRNLNVRNLGVSINNTVIDTREMNYFNSINDSAFLNVPLSLLSTNSAKIDFANLSAVSGDRMVVGMYELQYPRQFNFGGQTNFEFELPANLNGNKLSIKNFNYEGTLPVLYDLTNGFRINAEVDDNGNLTLVLPPSSVSRKLVLASISSSRIVNVNNFIVRNFIDYSTTANQVNYIIISNPLIYFDKNGVNQVEAYAQYRSSVAGGGYKTLTADINQLIDQFGWGIKNNPLSVRNFLRYTRNISSEKDQYCLLIGKGVSPNLVRNRVGYNIENRRAVSYLNLIPTFGVPSSDALLASEDDNVIAKTHIGRLNVVDANEVKDYLDKIRIYDESQKNPSCNIDDEIWKKNFIHIGGANDFLGEQIMYYLDRYKDVAEDTLIGANVYTLQKSALTNVQVLAGETVTSLFKNGFSLMTYFGHSSIGTLEFNLDNPENYPYSGKFPVFLVNGCNAGNLFILDSLRLNGSFVLSEKYIVSAPLRGAIGFIASTHLGVVNYLNIYTEEFYHQITNQSYGKSLGVIMSSIADTLISRFSINDFFIRQHVEQITLHGDPVLKLYYHEKPDYAIEDKTVKVSPEFISIAEKNYEVKIQIYNTGRVESDSLQVRVEKLNPDNTRDTLFNNKIPYISNVDSLAFTVPVNAETDKGAHKIIVTLDPENLIEESCETNNSVTKEYFIYQDEIRPVYPYNYSIINTADFTFYASTANPLNLSRNYYFEIDTSQSFTSPAFKMNKLISGGVVDFKPSSLSLENNRVYYWRVGVKKDDTEIIVWNSHSFIYRPDLKTGFNQSDFYQFKDNLFYDLTLTPSARQYEFKEVKRKLTIRTGLPPFYTANKNNVSLDLQILDQWRCTPNVFSIYILDPKSLEAWKNTGSLYGSLSICSPPRKFFEYLMTNQDSRNNAREFLENIVPDSMLVLIINQGTTPGAFGGPNTSFIQDWMKDTLVYGSGKSIYHTMINNGLTQINNFTRNLPFAFLYKKGDQNFVRQFIGDTLTDYIDVVLELPALLNNGTIETPWLGPAKKWDTFYWDGEYPDGQSSKDTVLFELVGKRKDGTEQTFINSFTNKETSISSFIDAKEFPYLKMKMFTEDSIKLTPFQLGHWRLTGDYVPEGALAPNIYFKCKDTVEIGEDIAFSVAFKNVSPVAFDSLRLSLTITTSGNKTIDIPLPRKKPLISGDTILVSYNINSNDYAGLNRLRLIVNPENDQPEQYFFNNILFKNVYVKPDINQSWLDVTFDGVHIVNKEIVSSKPQIAIKIKDDNKFIPILEQDDILVKIKFPKIDTPFIYRLGSDSARFTSSDINSGVNELMINLTPNLFQDGDYELTLEPRETSLFSKYKIGFAVFNKPMISNMFNYPNPFTSSTAFVFTLTGSQIPQNLRIQILTISGKVVKEITKDELGPLRIGKNITEYKWDGTDQYGNRLANGVYLYRVITNLNSKRLDKYVDQNENTDKYFNNGYGKMYLMR